MALEELEGGKRGRGGSNFLKKADSSPSASLKKGGKGGKERRGKGGKASRGLGIGGVSVGSGLRTERESEEVLFYYIFILFYFILFYLIFCLFLFSPSPDEQNVWLLYFNS